MLNIKFILSLLLILTLSACGNSDTGAVVGNVAVIQGGGAINNGPISGATVTISKLNGSILGSTTSIAYNEARDTTLVAGQRRLNNVGRTVGKFSLLPANFNFTGVLSTDILVIRASGGIDIDPNDDGIIAPTGEGAAGPIVVGSNYAFVQFSDLQNQNIIVNQFTTLAYAAINDRNVNPATIRQRLNRFSQFYFKDINGDGFSDYRDAYFYSPAQHSFDVYGNPSRDHDKFLSDPHFLRDLLFLQDPYTNLTFMQTLRANPNSVAEISTYLMNQFGDTDGDGLPDVFEDPLTIDTDGDGTPNATDLDDDNDGMSDVAELANGLNPWKKDANADPDGDGVSNINELAAGTNPFTLPLLAIGVPSANTSEAGGTATLSFRLTSAPTQNILVDVSSSNITEVAVTPALLTFTAGNWSVPQAVNLTGVDDMIIDGNQLVNIVGTVRGGTVVDTALAVVSNLDNEVAGVVLSAASGTTSEAGTTANFTISLQAQPTANLSVDLYSSNKAEITVPATVNFTPANWNMAQTVTLTGIDDPYTDGNQVVTITAVSRATSGYLGQSNTLTVTNIDNDVAALLLSPPVGTTSEAQMGQPSYTEATFNVSLQAKPTATVNITFSSSNTTEVNTPTSISFTSANWNAPQNIVLTGVDDPMVDGNQIVNIYATASGGGYAGVVNFVSVSNTDNDVSGLSVNSNLTSNTTEAGGATSFLISLAAQPTADVIVDVYSADPTEIRVTSASMTFTTLNWNMNQTATLLGLDDPYTDGNQAIVITAKASTTGNFNADTYSLTISNIDNDVAGIIVSSVTGSTTEIQTGQVGFSSANFDVKLKAQPTANVTVSFASDKLNEIVAPVTLTFTALNWDMYQNIIVTGLDDLYTDGNQMVTLTATASATGGYNAETASVMVNNADNEVAGVIATAPLGNTDENGATTTFTVKLKAQPTADVTMNIQSQNTAEVAHATPLIFTSTNWSTYQQVTLTGVADLTLDGNVVVDIYAIATGGGYNGEKAAVQVTNNNTDIAGVNGTVSGPTTENGTPVSTLNIALVSKPSANVVVDIYSTNLAEVIVATPQLTFTPLNWNMIQQVNVAGVDDPYTDGNQIVNLYAQVNAASGGYSNEFVLIPVTNLDNEIAGLTATAASNNTSEAGTTATFTVVLNAQPTATVLVDVYSANTTEVTVATPQLTFTQANWNMAQTVTVTGVNDPYTDGLQAVNVYAQVNPASGGYNSEFTTVIVSNDDNDVAGITATAASNNTSENATTATFTVVLNAQPTANVIVDVYSANTTEVTVVTPQLTFTQANWNMAQTVTVTGVNDPYTDGVQAVSVYAQVNAASGGYSNEFATVVVNNDDNDLAAITATAASNNTSELGVTATFTIALAAQPTATVIVDMYSANTAEVTVATPQLTFTQANWNMAQTVTVTGVDDPYTDGVQAVNVYAQVNAASGGYSNESTTVVVNNDDNEIAGLTATAASNNTSEAGTTATFTVVLNAQPTATVLVDVYSADIGEVQVDTGYTQLTFTQANWNMAQTVQVSGVNDPLVDGTQAVNVYAQVNVASIAAFADVYAIVIVSNDEEDLDAGVGDGMPDDWEFQNNLNRNIDDSGLSINRDPSTGVITDALSTFDLDRDGLINIHEYLCGTNPNGGFVDTDLDGFSDDFENCLAQTGWTSLGVNAVDNRDLDSDGDGIANFDEYIDYHALMNAASTPYILQTRKGQSMQAAGFIYVPGGWDLDNDGVKEAGFWIAQYEAKDAGVAANTVIPVSSLLQGAQVFNPTAGTQRFVDRLCDNANQDPAANIGLALDAYTSDLTGACRGNQYTTSTLTTLALIVNKVVFNPVGVPLVNESWLEAKAALLSSPVVAATTISGLGGTLTNPDNTVLNTIDLPSEVQHMQLVQLIINNAQDWYGNTLNVNGVFRGNSNSIAASAAAIGTGINTRTHTIANNTTVFGYPTVGVQGTVVVNDPAVPLAYSATIYDLAGNVYEWTLGMIAANANTGAGAGGDRFVSGNANWVEYTAITGTMPLWWKPVLSNVQKLDSTNDIGKYNDGIQIVGATGAADNINIGYTPTSPTAISSGFSAVARGGRWDDGTSAGVASASLVYGPGYQDLGIGFRAAAP